MDSTDHEHAGQGHSLDRNIGTIVLDLEAGRGGLNRLSGGVVDAGLLRQLEAARREHFERRMCGVVAFGPRGPSRIETEVRLLDVGPAPDGVGQLPGVLTLGRHDQCDIGGIRGAALRHALLMVYPPEGDEPTRLEALDLSSGVGLGVGQSLGVPQVLARSRVRFGVGGFSVIAFVAEPGECFFPEGVEGALAFFDRGATGGGLQLTLPARPRDEVEPTEALRHLRAHEGVWSEGSRVSMGTVVNAIEPNAYVVEATGAELREGVLLGRYPRCRGSLELQLHGDISRVHALLLERRGLTFLIDCGSTNGTELRHPGARTVVLGPEQRIWPWRSGDQALLGALRLELEVV